MKFRKNQIIPILCTAALFSAMVLGGCSSGDSTGGGASEGGAAGDAIAVQVQSLDGSTITALKGELAEDPAARPDGASGPGFSSGPGVTEPPAGGNSAPDGGNYTPDGPAPNGPNPAGAAADGTGPGNTPAGLSIPDGPTSSSSGGASGNSGDASGSSSGASSSSSGAGGAEPPAGGDDGTSRGAFDWEGHNGMSRFTAGSESITFTITDSTVITLESASGSADGTIDDIAAGSILEITLNNDNSAASVIVKQIPSGRPPVGQGQSQSQGQEQVQP